MRGEPKQECEKNTRITVARTEGCFKFMVSSRGMDFLFIEYYITMKQRTQKELVRDLTRE
jgi:hypothetical protein